MKYYYIFYLIISAVIIILGIAIGIYIRNSKNQSVIDWRKKYSDYKVKLAIFGLFFTFIGLFLTGFNDILSQYATWWKPFVKLYEKKSVEDISKFCTNNNNNVTIVFILDVSGSINENLKFPIRDDIKNQIKAVQTSRLPSNSKTKYYAEYLSGTAKEIKFSELLKLRLSYLLAELDKNRFKGRFSIVTFANSATFFVSEEYANYKNLRAAFDLVNSIIKFDGGNTDFCDLFATISNTLIDSTEYSFVFLSDYLQDSEKNDIYYDTKCIKNHLSDIESKEIFFNFYVLDENKLKEHNKKNLINISDVFFKDNDKCNKTDIFEAYYLVSRGVTEHYIPFYYRNKSYEKELSSYISFKKVGQKAKDFKFKISYTERDEKLLLKLDCRNGIIPVTENPIILPSNISDEPKLIMSGHIPTHNQSCGRIIIEDVVNKREYAAKIVFIQKLPSYLMLVLPLFLAIILAYFIIIALKKCTCIKSISLSANNLSIKYKLEKNAVLPSLKIANQSGIILLTADLISNSNTVNINIAGLGNNCIYTLLLLVGDKVNDSKVFVR